MSNSPIDLLTETDLDNIEAYRDKYMFLNQNGTQAPLDIKELLSVWSENKQRLFKIFGNKLILSKTFTYDKPDEELELEISQLRHFDTKRQDRHPDLFYKEYNNFVNDYGYTWENDIRDELYILSHSNSLKNNIYTGRTFTITTPNKKQLVIEHGCKATKALGKIVKAFNLPYFEDFRICHSQILNQKHLKGTLTLSIHPLDYMTMSDNNSGWSSCMSWRGFGGYRQGTVEMMNSPNVVVAYFSSDTDMILPNGAKWNNKKWRSLIVADPKAIAHIKNYPYDNIDFTKRCVDWLKELTTKTLGETYYDSEYMKDLWSIQLPDLPTFAFIPSTSNMYNDFNCSDIGHCIAFSTSISEEQLTTYVSGKQLRLHYSGEPQCMCCGARGIDIPEENRLVCDECESIHYCSWCDEAIGGEVYWINDEPYCQYCYEQHIQECNSCTELVSAADAYVLHIVPKNPKGWQQDMLRQHRWLQSLTRDGKENAVVGSFDSNDLTFCSEDCLIDFAENQLVEGAQIYTGWNEGGYENMFFIYNEDLKVPIPEINLKHIGNYGTLYVVNDIMPFYSP